MTGKCTDKGDCGIGGYCDDCPHLTITDEWQEALSDMKQPDTHTK